MFNNVLIEPYILANPFLLHRLMNMPLDEPLSEQDCYADVFHAFHSCHYALPDHVARNRWKALFGGGEFLQREWSLPALDSIARLFLEYREGNIRVSQGCFDLWQSVISRMSFLPVRAAFECALSLDEPLPIEPAFFPTPFDPPVESYVERCGLHESHLHLNGSTPAEYVWLLAMDEPKKALIPFRGISPKKKDGRAVRELLRSVDERLTPNRLLERCILAQQLRAFLLHIARYKSSFNLFIGSNGGGGRYALHPSRLAQDRLIPVFLRRGDRRGPVQRYEEERDWQLKVIRKLKVAPCALIERAFHLYLLLQNQFVQLLVQREDLWGFDEFQKVTLNELRSPSEKTYQHRFEQFHGDVGGKGQLSSLEGRFAPKDSLEGSEDCLRKILRGYFGYLKGHGQIEKDDARPLRSFKLFLDTLEEAEKNCAGGRLRLALVAHFIKKEWSRGGRNDFHFRALRIKLQKQALLLRAVLRRYPKMALWLRGVDAASNELDAPPEVFASVFRLCRHFGIEHATYHVGEDFVHLLGGIRQVDDALRFLGLRSGDRLGHCTSIGIDPGKWQSSMPVRTMLRRGDFLLDMLSLWRHMRYRDGCVASRAATEALRVGRLVFGEELSLEELDGAMGLRHLHQGFVFEASRKDDWHWRDASLDDHLREEAEMIYEEAAKTKDKRRLKLLCRWWEDEEVSKMAWGCYEEVPSDFCDVSELLAYQQSVLSEVSRRRIIMETLPTSNVRISQYREMKEHHVFRWMKMPGRATDGDPDIMVCLGSDDPGIFAETLKGEFYHLYSVLREEFSMSDDEALARVAAINERGRVYRFHHRASAVL